MKHLKALLVLFAGFLMLVLGTPGLDYQKWGRHDSPDEQADTIEDYGPVWGNVIIGISLFNKHVRRPVYQRFEDIQRPFRIRQSWHLYRDGPSRVRRLNVYVDGTLVHRSADDGYGWNDPVLRNRHVRPVAENVARKKGTPNWRGFTRWIVTEAREDFPDCHEVRIEATSARFPGTDESVHHYYIATAPDWKVTEHDPNKPDKPRTRRPGDAPGDDAADDAADDGSDEEGDEDLGDGG
ncbi:MAG: hypothetical protein H6742_03340 [Alphaproteobacteria bacterium]|nr:hypothetical protein [Alphaproteobacteria bacterium]